MFSRSLLVSLQKPVPPSPEVLEKRVLTTTLLQNDRATFRDLHESVGDCVKIKWLSVFLDLDLTSSSRPDSK